MTYFVKVDVLVGACPIEWLNNHLFLLDVDYRAEFGAGASVDDGSVAGVKKDELQLGSPSRCNYSGR